MADENTSENENPENTEGEAPKNETPPEENNEDSQEKPKETSPEDELPEWAQKELKKARGDAARYRTSLRDAEAKLADAKTPEEFEAARAELAEENEKLQTQLAREKLVNAHSLPEDVAALLSGTAEEMETQAKLLASHIAAPQPKEASGGLSPSDDGDDGYDPVAAVRKARNRGY